jgi:hypothetical protein
LREKWTPLTSRRFCEFCAVEQKQHDLLPRAAAVVLFLFGVAGFTAYVGGSNSVTGSKTERAKTSAPIPKLAERNDVASNRADTSKAPPANANSSAAANLAPSNSIQRRAVSNSSTEPVYYCGAMTKKGTPCTRRVKVPGRCWQHAGQRVTKQ